MTKEPPLQKTDIRLSPVKIAKVDEIVSKNDHYKTRSDFIRKATDHEIDRNEKSKKRK